MGSSELGLVHSVGIEGFSDLLIHLKFIRDLKLYKELGGVGNSLEILGSEKDPKEDVVNGSLVALLDLSLYIMHES